MIHVHLCCNDPDNGEFYGELTDVEFTDDCEFLSVHGDPMDGEAMRFDFEAGAFFVHAERYEMKSHRSWTGNWCWDSVMTTAEDAARLANQLKAFKHWSCEVAREDLYERWGDPAAKFEAKDFKEVEK